MYKLSFMQMFSGQIVTKMQWVKCVKKSTVPPLPPPPMPKPHRSPSHSIPFNFSFPPCSPSYLSAQTPSLQYYPFLPSPKFNEFGVFGI